MNNAGAQPVASYGDLIREVFISPIRSAMVVDDEFPTLDRLLAKEAGDEMHGWQQEHAEKAKEIVGFCRAPGRGWTVDIDDARDLARGEGASQRDLHQSDLVILDYHLDRDNPNDNAVAIEKLRQLADNDHFNLVIVYTKGYLGAGDSIERVAREIGIGLCYPDKGLVMDSTALAHIDDALAEWEDSEPHVLHQVRDTMQENAYLQIRSAGERKWTRAESLPEWAALQSLLDKAPESLKKRLNAKGLFKWGLHHRQAAVAGKLSRKDYRDFSWDCQPDGTNWIRTDRLFATVIGKSVAPADLPDRLLRALIRWKPEPHRLLMSKMRAVLEAQGVIAESEVLRNRCLQAAWLQEYLTEDAAERTWKIRGTIGKHWESLGDAITGNVADFAESLAQCLLHQGGKDAIKEHAPIDLQKYEKDIALHRNIYNCSKPVEGRYLTTGHVFQIDSDADESEFWICLSPACDLVPGQKSRAQQQEGGLESGPDEERRRKSANWAVRLGSHTAFIGVQLSRAGRDEALKGATSNNFLFLDIEGSPEIFRFVPSAPKDSSISSNPKWEQMFACRQGRFDDSENELFLRRIEESNDFLVSVPVKARVVAQLRYEYALNLLSRLGANFSRVGLNFS